MLSAEERERILAEIPPESDPSAAVIEALKIVQMRSGWVSDEQLADVAETLEMSAAEVENVATFYNHIHRRPVGTHVILVCDSVSCWLTGYEDVVARLSERLGIGLGETTADGLFTLLPVACLGACDRAPAMMVDDVLYTGLDAAAIDETLARYGLNVAREEAR